jgi:hypothetical protein
MLRLLTTLIPVAALAAGPAFAQGGFLGVQLQDAPEGSSGALIASVQERSAATVMGLRAGDQVLRVDGVAVADPQALADLIGARLPGDIVELTIRREGAEQRLLGVLARRAGAVPAGARERGAWLRSDVPAPPLPPEPPTDFEFELPEWSFDSQDLAPQLQDLHLRLQELHQRHEALMHQLHEQLQGMEFNWSEMPEMNFAPDGFSFRIEGAPEGIFLHPGAPRRSDSHTQVHLRYPENTSPAERERLRVEAIAKYGEGVQVEFAGTGTTVTIQRQSRSTSGEPEAVDSREF